MKTRYRRRRKNSSSNALENVTQILSIGMMAGLAYAMYWAFSQFKWAANNSNPWAPGGWLQNLFGPSYTATNPYTGAPLVSPFANVQGSVNYMDEQGNVHDVNGVTGEDVIIAGNPNAVQAGSGSGGGGGSAF